MSAYQVTARTPVSSVSVITATPTTFGIDSRYARRKSASSSPLLADPFSGCAAVRLDDDRRDVPKGGIRVDVACLAARCPDVVHDSLRHDVPEGVVDHPAAKPSPGRPRPLASVQHEHPGGKVVARAYAFLIILETLIHAPPPRHGGGMQITGELRDET